MAKNKFDEDILCIKSDLLFQKGKWNGIKSKNLDYYYKLLLKSSEFRRRGDLENDSNFKQIIPQVVLRHGRNYFLHYQADISEKRLANMYPLPLGGHVETLDVPGNKDVIQSALERELDEEAIIKSKIIDRTFLGLIYIEDENPVNTYHLGLAYIFDLDGKDVEMNESNLQKVGFVGVGYLNRIRKKLTHWSRLLVESGLLQSDY